MSLIKHSANLKSKVVDIKSVAEETKLISFERPTWLKSYLPGQHGVIEFIINNQVLKRVYSLVSIETESILSIIVKNVKEGAVSNYLNNKLLVGDDCRLIDVYGNYNVDKIKKNKLLFLAAGSGVTPFISMIKQLNQIGFSKEIFLLHSAKTTSQLIYQDFFKEISQKNSLFKYLTYTTKEGNYSRLSLPILKELIPDIRNRIIICCGPNRFVTDCLLWLQQLGVDSNHIYQECFLTNESNTDSEGYYKITLSKQNKNFFCSKKSTILNAAEKANIFIPSGCRAGQCGVCKLNSIDGKIKYILKPRITNKTKLCKEILTCCAVPESDIVLDC